VGLAVASALVVLLGSGVAVSRLGSDDRPARDGEIAASPSAPTPTGAGGGAVTGSAPDGAGAPGVPGIEGPAPVSADATSPAARSVSAKGSTSAMKPGA